MSLFPHHTAEQHFNSSQYTDTNRDDQYQGGTDSELQVIPDYLPTLFQGHQHDSDPTLACDPNLPLHQCQQTRRCNQSFQRAPTDEVVSSIEYATCSPHNGPLPQISGSEQVREQNVAAAFLGPHHRPSLTESEGSTPDLHAIQERSESRKRTFGPASQETPELKRRKRAIKVSITLSLSIVVVSTD